MNVQQEISKELQNAQKLLVAGREKALLSGDYTDWYAWQSVYMMVRRDIYMAQGSEPTMGIYELLTIALEDIQAMVAYNLNTPHRIMKAKVIEVVLAALLPYVEAVEQRRQAALAKLTAEDRIVLGV